MTVIVIDVPMCSFSFGFGLIPYVNEAKLDTSIHFFFLYVTSRPYNPQSCCGD